MSDESPYERFVRETGLPISRATYYRIRAEISDESKENRLQKILDAERTGLYEEAAKQRRERKNRSRQERHEQKGNKIPF